MKKINLIAMLVVLCLAACTPKAAINSSSAPAQAQSDSSPAQQAALTSLSKTLSIAPEQITVSSSEAVVWPNGCMGIQRIGVMCTQKETPGFRIVLEASGKQYEFHTNQDGSMIVPADLMQVPSVAQAAMVKQLATKLGVQESDISVVSSAAVQWSDSCFGVAIDGTTCTNGVTSGYLIVLEAGGTQYEYHTNDDGSQFVLVP